MAEGNGSHVFTRCAVRTGRRSLLLGGGAMLTMGMFATSQEVLRATTWLRAWDSHGSHRTATPGDEQGAEWLAAEVRAMGAPVQFESFPLDRVDTEAAFLEIEGERIPGEPMQDAPDTPDGRVMALAGAGNNLAEPSQAEIHVLELAPFAVYSPDFARFRRESRSKALVVVTKGGAPGLALMNAEAFKAPFGPPILQVSSAAGPRIIDAVRRGAALRVVVRTRRTRAEARNVVVTLPGRDRNLPKLVVMTPRSSWYQSTAERGGGLVCWLEALRALIARPPARDVVFTANSGHEIGHIGLDDFMARRPGWDRPGGASWIHYGANIGAAQGELHILSNADDLRGLFQTELTTAGYPANRVADKTFVPNGETRDIHKVGGHYLTLMGTNRLFHLPQDRFPDAVDVEAIARVSAGSAAGVISLSR